MRVITGDETGLFKVVDVEQGAVLARLGVQVLVVYATLSVRFSVLFTPPRFLSSGPRARHQSNDLGSRCCAPPHVAPVMHSTA